MSPVGNYVRNVNGEKCKGDDEDNVDPRLSRARGEGRKPFRGYSRLLMVPSTIRLGIKLWHIPLLPRGWRMLMVHIRSGMILIHVSLCRALAGQPAHRTSKSSEIKVAVPLIITWNVIRKLQELNCMQKLIQYRSRIIQADVASNEILSSGSLAMNSRATRFFLVA